MVLYCVFYFICAVLLSNMRVNGLAVFTLRAAIACIGGMYEKLGRMVGRSYEETVGLLIKSLKNAEVNICSHGYVYDV